MTEIKKIAVAVTGASGAIYARVLLDKLCALPGVELGLVMTENAKDVWRHELGNSSYEDYAVKRFALNDYFAPFASGSSTYRGLIICPCSMGTLGRIASGVSDTLITRAADVMLKERRPLICVVRDTPYNLIHINAMKTVTEAGGMICPASPSFYSRPENFDALAATVVDRTLSLLGMADPAYRWGETS